MPDILTNQEMRSGRVVLIMGPPNAGKDTQAELLAHRLNGAYIGSGELIRREGEPRLMEIMARGDLIPAEDLRRLLGNAIQRVGIETPIVLAGTAKKPAEAHWLAEYLPSIDRWLDRVILIALSKEESVKRSQKRDGDRQDDDPLVQQERWDRYFAETMQSLNFFRERGVLAEVSGFGARDLVASRIDKILSN